MVGSANTNLGAQIALRNLNVTGADLASAQKKISTGLRVSDALDNGAVFAIAQGLRSDVSAITTVNGQIGGAIGILKVSNFALTSSSNLMTELRGVVTQLADQNVTGNARVQLNAQYGTLVQSYYNFLQGATYNGVNLILPNVSTGLLGNGVPPQNVIIDASANQYDLTLKDDNGHINANIGPSLFSYTAYDGNGNPTGFTPTTPANATAAATLLSSVVSEQNTIGTQLNSVASSLKQLEGQLTFNNALSDATTQGLGALVDADLAKESAKLQSLQIKQQLGTQSLGIANQSPQSLLALFR